MSVDEPEARMWDEELPSHYQPSVHGVFYESAFASSEHLDRAPLLSDETYSEVAVNVDDEAEHCHWKGRPDPPSAVPQLVAALVLCAVFMVCELVGGYLAGSLSVMSDAAHMLSDCGGFALALLAFHCARRRPDCKLSYGYKRAEVLGAMASVLLTWALTVALLVLAARRLRSGEYELNADTMLAVASAGVFFNVVLAMVLHGCGCQIAHHHTHGGAACAHSVHSHGGGAPRTWLQRLRRKPEKPTNGSVVNGDYTLKEIPDVEVSRGRNINHRAALVHVIGDLVQSCGVLVASVIVKIYPSAKFVDPLCTFVFGVVVLATTWRVLRDALAIFMQAVPPDFRYRACVTALGGVAGVRHVHSAHAWALSSHHVVFTAHVAIDALSDADTVLRACQHVLRQHPGLQSSTLQVERYSPAMLQCRTCQDQPAAST